MASRRTALVGGTHHDPGPEGLVGQSLLLGVPQRPQIVDELDNVAYALDPTDQTGNQPPADTLSSTRGLTGGSVDQVNTHATLTGRRARDTLAVAKQPSGPHHHADAKDNTDHD